MGTLFITSTGFSPEPTYSAFSQLASRHNYSSVAIVTTAAKDKSGNKYAKLAFDQFESLDFQAITFTDLEEDPHFDFAPFDVIYVCGGNTFTLLKFALQADFKPSVEALLNRGGCYVGVSAGSLILSPTIDAANDIEPADPNEVELTDLTALGLIPFHLHVHDTAQDDEAVRSFEQKHGTIVKRIGDEEFLTLNH